MMYSSFSGSMGTFAVDYINSEFPKVAQTYVSVFPDSDCAKSIASPMETYNFPHHMHNIDGSLAIMLTNKQLAKYCKEQNRLEFPSLRDCNEVVVDFVKSLTADNFSH